MRRLIVSLLLLPWVVGSGCGLAALWTIAPGGSGNPGFLPIALFSGLFTYLYLIVPTLPLLVLCLWRKWTKPFHAALVGAVTGLTVHLSTASSLFFNSELELGYRLAQLSTALPITALGSMVGLIFWLMAFWRQTPRRLGAASAA